MARANNQKKDNSPTLNYEIFGFDENGNDVNIPISAIRDLFATDNSLTEFKIYSTQLDYVGQSIEDLVDKKYFPTSYTETEMLTGLNIELTKTAKFAFIIQGKNENPYLIIDVLGNDITSNFDVYYIENISYYVSKYILTPSTVFFKFVKNN